MTPFIAWSQNKTGADDAVIARTPMTVDSDFRIELGFLQDALLDNMISSSALQLRHVHIAMEESRVEKQQREQDVNVAKALMQIEEKISGAVADILTPVLSQLQTMKVISEFASVLKKILPEFADQTLLIQAPPDVHGKLAAAMQHHGLAANIQANDGPHIFVSGDNLVLRAELGHWSEALMREAAA
jgi:hypothetical protein